MVIFVLLDTGVYLLQTTTSSSAKMTVFIFPQQSPISGWALANSLFTVAELIGTAGVSVQFDIYVRLYCDPRG
jgi:hypothetical protein